jgi:BMFP domain-containing protein YqiC
MTSAYVQNLTRLDLVDLAPESRALELEYEIVLATRTVREALNNRVGPLPARAVRQTLRLSPLGRELWDVCRASTRP